MTVRIAAITGLFVSAGLLAGCQNATPHLGQATLGGNMYGPHVASQQPHNGDPFLNNQQSYESARYSGHVRVAGTQQPPQQGYATSNPAPTMIQQGGYQQPVMPAGYQHSVTPAGYQQPAGPFNAPATVPVGNAGWQSSQPPIQTIAR